MRNRTMSWMLPAVVIAIAGAVASAAIAGQKAVPASTGGFEALKQLAGDWVEVGPNGQPAGPVVSSVRVTAAGSVVQETLFPGTDHEMVTMYYMDGLDLVLTHYCILGNQPRMRAEPGKEPNQLVFRFTGGGNLKSEDDNHMHEATLTLVNKDHYQAEWTACKDGKPCHKATFNMVRKVK